MGPPRALIAQLASAILTLLVMCANLVMQAISVEFRGPLPALPAPPELTIQTLEPPCAPLAQKDLFLLRRQQVANHAPQDKLVTLLIVSLVALDYMLQCLPLSVTSVL